MTYLDDISIYKQILTFTEDLQRVYVECEGSLLFSWTVVGVAGSGVWAVRCGRAPCGLWVGHASFNTQYGSMMYYIPCLACIVCVIM